MRNVVTNTDNLRAFIAASYGPTEWETHWIDKAGAPRWSHAKAQLEDPENFLERAHQILSQPESESYDVLRLQDGRVFERYSRPQRLGETTVGRVWSFRDVTERERSMIEIREANRLLEVKNAELERFTYTVSHDLKSPLITIRGYMGHLEASAAAGDMEALTKTPCGSTGRPRKWKSCFATSSSFQGSAAY